MSWLKTKLPEPKKRKEILIKYIKEDPGALELLGQDGTPPDVSGAAQASDHFCCADLRRVVNDAKLLAAWDRKASLGKKGKQRSGAAYLEDAAQAVHRMQQEVKANMRSMYG